MSRIFLAPWREIREDEEREAIQQRYDAEITEAHSLAGLNGRVFARCDANDDILVRIESGQLAIVHLTWAAGEADWPHFSAFDSIEDALFSIEEERLL